MVLVSFVLNIFLSRKLQLKHRKTSINRLIQHTHCSQTISSPPHFDEPYDVFLRRK